MHSGRVAASGAAGGLTHGTNSTNGSSRSAHRGDAAQGGPTGREPSMVLASIRTVDTLDPSFAARTSSSTDRPSHASPMRQVSEGSTVVRVAPAPAGATTRVAFMAPTPQAATGTGMGTVATVASAQARARVRGRRSSAHHAVPIHKVHTLTRGERRAYYFRHPYARLAVAFGIIFLNFLIMAEDPQAHSKVDAVIPAIGNAFSLVATQWPAHGGFLVLKFLFALASVIGGSLFMLHVVHHRCLRPRLEMFAESKGTWWVMFTGTIVWALIGSVLYNAALVVLLPGGAAEARGRGWFLNDELGVNNSVFVKAAAVGTWLGDSITALMVWDMVLQTDKMYPDWQPALRKRWNTGCDGRLRIIAFWSSIVVASVMVVITIGTNAINWDAINGGLIFTDEFTRALLASFITVCDVLILAQDFDFPEFNTTQDIKMPGLGIGTIKWDPFGCINKKWLGFTITGKWMNYGIISIVMLLDMNMLKNQLLYEPSINGQYTGPDDHIYSVVNVTALPALLANPELLSYDVRGGEASGDLRMNARYRGYTLVLTILAAVPAVAAIIAMLYTIRKHRLQLVHEEEEETAAAAVATGGGSGTKAGGSSDKERHVAFTAAHRERRVARLRQLTSGSGSGRNFGLDALDDGDDVEPKSGDEAEEKGGGGRGRQGGGSPGHLAVALNVVNVGDPDARDGQ